MTLQNAPPGLDYERDKKFSKVWLCYMISGKQLIMLLNMLFVYYVPYSPSSR